MATSPAVIEEQPTVKERPAVLENKKAAIPDSSAQELSEHEMIHQRILQTQQDEVIAVTEPATIAEIIVPKESEDKPQNIVYVTGEVFEEQPQLNAKRLYKPVVEPETKLIIPEQEPTEPVVSTVPEIIPGTLEIPQVFKVPKEAKAPKTTLFDLSQDEVDDLFDKPLEYPAIELKAETFSLDDEARELAGEIGLVVTDEIEDDDWVEQFLLAKERVDIADTLEKPSQHPDTILAVMPESVLVRVAEYIQEAEPEEAVELESLTVFIESAANRLEELMVMEEADSKEIALTETAVIEFYDQLLRQVGMEQAEEREELAKQFIGAIYLRIENKAIPVELPAVIMDDEGTHEHKQWPLAPLFKKDFSLITRKFNFSVLGSFTVRKATI